MVRISYLETLLIIRYRRGAFFKEDESKVDLRMFLTFFPSLLLGTHLGHIFGKFLENACKLLIFLQISVLLISKIVILLVAQILFFYPSLVYFQSYSVTFPVLASTQVSQ